jgi:hypothetical protein
MADEKILESPSTAPQKARLRSGQVYVYVGDGLGVPGLAHEISQAQAEAQGVGDTLAACIALGMYVVKADAGKGT